MTHGTYSKPSDVTADKCQVQMDGPDGVDVALTPLAAEETARRLAAAASAARDQSRRADDKKPA